MKLVYLLLLTTCSLEVFASEAPPSSARTSQTQRLHTDTLEQDRTVAQKCMQRDSLTIIQGALKILEGDKTSYKTNKMLSALTNFKAALIKIDRALTQEEKYVGNAIKHAAESHGSLWDTTNGHTSTGYVRSIQMYDAINGRYITIINYPKQ